MPYKRKSTTSRKKRTPAALSLRRTRLLAASPPLQYRDRVVTFVLSPGIDANYCVNELLQGSTAGHRDKNVVRVVGINFTGMLVPAIASSHPNPAVDLAMCMYIPKSGADLIDTAEDATRTYPRRYNTDEFKILKKWEWKGRITNYDEPVTKQAISMHQSFGPRGIEVTYGRSSSTGLGNVPYKNPVYLNMIHLGQHDVGIITLDGSVRTWYYEN